jgi:hypothetical protein
MADLPDLASRERALQARIDLAFRRLQLGLQRSGYVFDGAELEEVVRAAIHVVEGTDGIRDRYAGEYVGPRTECGCPDRPDEAYQPHPGQPCDWSEWHPSQFEDLREDRFCWRCGSMETQRMDLEP